MKDFKRCIVDRMNARAKEVHSFMLRTSALDCGYKHINRQDAEEIVNAFLKANPSYKPYWLDGEPSYFFGVFLTDNECLPLEDMERLAL